MELRRYVDLAIKWLWLAVLGAAIAAGATYGFSQAQAPIYRASTTLLVKQPSGATSSDSYSAILSSERLTRTYSELVRKRPILDEVNLSLGLPYTSEKLAQLISVQLVRDTQLLVIAVENTNPNLAKDIANRLAQVFVERAATIYTDYNTDASERMDRQLNDLEQEVRRTSQTIETLRAGGTGSQQQQTDMARLQNTLTQLQSTHSTLLRNREETRMSALRSMVTVSVVEIADVPLRPVRPRILFNVSIAAAIGLALSVALAFLLEYFDDSIRSPEDVERVIGLNTIGSIRLFRPDEAGEGSLILTDGARSALSEAYRVLRTNIQFTSLDKTVKTILVTSANPSEGKSTTLANLGIVMAQAGRRVILVDADLRRPSLHRYFGLSNAIGLTNLLLSNNPEGATVFQPTGVENLSLLSSGPLPPNPSELLGSQRMARALEYFSNQADIILVDSPPVLSVTDPVVLSATIDGIIIVVDAGRTRSDGLIRAKELLAASRTPILGIVLNKILESSAGHYYNYHNYNQYGQSARDAKGKRRASGDSKLTGDLLAPSGRKSS